MQRSHRSECIDIAGLHSAIMHMPISQSVGPIVLTGPDLAADVRPLIIESSCVANVSLKKIYAYLVDGYRAGIKLGSVTDSDTHSVATSFIGNAEFKQGLIGSPAFSTCVELDIALCDNYDLSL